MEPAEFIHPVHSFQKAVHFYCQVDALAFHNANGSGCVKEHSCILTAVRRSGLLIGSYPRTDLLCLILSVAKERLNLDIIKQIKQLFIQRLEEKHLFLGDLSSCIEKPHVYQTAPGAVLLARGGLYLFIYNSRSE